MIVERASSSGDKDDSDIGALLWKHHIRMPGEKREDNDKSDRREMVTHNLVRQTFRSNGTRQIRKHKKQPRRERGREKLTTPDDEKAKYRGNYTYCKEDKNLTHSNKQYIHHTRLQTIEQSRHYKKSHRKYQKSY